MFLKVIQGWLGNHLVKQTKSFITGFQIQIETPFKYT